ncbi:hypothetical protein OF83DRAFT_1066514 [Amylostereum chailletii]|nr:hypothetical protein OF83DRAFT_1066514 [Amylostereum chailletii]
MILTLTTLLSDFPGAANQTRCFAHIINLVCKTILREFDLPKKKGEEAMANLDEQLKKLGEDIEAEEMAMCNEMDDDVEDDDIEGWIDELAEMGNMECDDHDQAVRPLRLCHPNSLLQIRKFAYAVVHSTTILLPLWKSVIAEVDLNERIMPRDVSTRWNSTFDMLDFALWYRPAINKMCEKTEGGMRVYELSNDEWKLVRQLRDVLTVRSLLMFSPVSLTL